jgi:hypothetical protein
MRWPALTLIGLLVGCSDDHHGSRSAATEAVSPDGGVVVSLPTLSAGASCPVTTMASTPSADLGPLIGDGPVRPGALNPAGAAFVFGGIFGSSEWAGAKVLWATGPSVDSPVLVRGRQLDGDEVVRFDQDADPASELVLSPSERAPLDGGWRDFRSAARVRKSGCYAFQVDTTTSTSSVVFVAVVG